MKTLLTAVACISLLTACQREEREPVAAEPVVVAPAETTPVAPAAEMPAATENTEVAPATTTTPATTTMPEAGAGTSGASAAGAMQGSGAGMYRVERGDTLWGIAQENRVNYNDLAEWNDISDPGMLREGQELRLSAP